MIGIEPETNYFSFITRKVLEVTLNLQAGLSTNG